MAAVAIVLLGGVVLFLIAQAEGADVGSLVSDVTDQIKSGVQSVGADLGLSGDPISIAMPIIKGFEGFSARRYPDPPGSGKYSIGYGHQVQPGEPYDENYVMSDAEGDSVLRSDMAASYSDVQEFVSVELTPNQAAALISFRYNVGSGAFQSSSLVSLLNQGDYEGAAAQFPQWIHSGGLVSQSLVVRRAQEQELFNA